MVDLGEDSEYEDFRINSMYSLACMFLYIYILLYEFLCNFYFPPLPLIAASLPLTLCRIEISPKITQQTVKGA